MSEAHAAMCVYCGESVIYDTREVSDMAAAHAKIVEHDQQCPRNPLVARIAELEADRFTNQELDIVRQWHNAVQDVSPRYLNADGIDDDSVFRKVCALIKEKE